MNEILKKIASFTLIFGILIFMPVYARDNSGVNIVPDGKYLWLASDTKQSVTVIAAAYTENRFLRCETWEETEVGPNAKKLDISSLLSNEANRRIKIFVWENLDTVKPIQAVEQSEVVGMRIDKDGSVCFAGYSQRAKVPFVVKDSDGKIVYLDQPETDENGYYTVKFKIGDFDANERYTIISNSAARVLYTLAYNNADAQISVTASEDTYVNGGAKADINFGTADTLSCRYYPNDKLYDRKGYFKFNILNVPKQGIKRVYFRYYVSGAESSYESVQLNLYGLNPTLWKENELTYNTQPEWGDFITQTSAVRGNIGMADITDYVMDRINSEEISFAAEGNTSNFKQQTVASREYENEAYRPKLIFCYEDTAEIFTDYKLPSYGNGVDPIENAKKMIQESTAEYSYPKLTETEYDYSEYVNQASARLSTSAAYSTFKTRRLENLKGYTAQKEPTLSIYGGDTSDKISDGTGFFEIKKVDGRWTLVDPLGYRFYSVGVTNVRPADSEAAYKEIVNNYNADVKEWANVKRSILFENKMNTAGAWSFMFRGFDSNTGKITDGLKYDAGVIENDNPIPTGCIIPNGVSIRYAKALNGVEGTGVEAFKGGVPPVFNPDFEEKCGEIIKNYTAPLKNSPYVIGWWSDNEINDSIRMLDDALALDTENELYVYTHATAWEWLRERLGRNDVGIWDLNDTLREEFREFVYDRYYQVMSRQFAIYAPNHLYLGNRHFETSVESPGVFAAAERYCDALSYNLYKYWTPSVVSKWEQYADMPVLITEFYSAENSAAGGWIVKEAEDVGSFYENYTLRLLEAANIIGLHYHSFGRFDGDDVNEYLVKAVKDINSQAYGLVKYFDERN